MSRSRSVKQLVYGLGALGGGVALLTTVLDKFEFDSEDLFRSRKQQTWSEQQIKNIKSQVTRSLQAETAAHDDHSSDTWTWPRWDWNWDQRQPVTDDNNSNERRGVKASRHLILIRHGQYNLDGKDDSERYLTQLGRDQASSTGVRLADMNLPYTHILHSNMTRAVETAQLISQHLPHVKMLDSDGILREGSPIRPEPRVGGYRYDHQYITDGSRIEAAFRRYFHRAESSQTEDSYEIIVCHANVIRYFVCRALQFPPEAWLRISLKHASLTWLTIRPDGRVSIRGLGEAGHLKPEMLTTS